MIKKILVTVAMTGAMSVGAVLPATTANAAANNSRFANCQRAAAERYANRLASGADHSRARRQFNNDIARCKRRFG